MKTDRKYCDETCRLTRLAINWGKLSGWSQRRLAEIGAVPRFTDEEWHEIVKRLKVMGV